MASALAALAVKGLKVAAIGLKKPSPFMVAALGLKASPFSTFSRFSCDPSPINTKEAVKSESISRKNGIVLFYITYVDKKSWDATVLANGFHLTLDMPGVSEEEVEVLVSEEKNSLEVGNRADDGKVNRWWRIDLPSTLKANNAEFVMKNGQVKVVVTKGKEEEEWRYFKRR